jgi:DNA-binding MarR family transcriptional regulator/N-acetylglutamate synthase-like GNAT family acetyltransferase
MNEATAERVDAIRRFHRFYTQKIGVLQEHLLESPFSLAEARVLYEIAQQKSTMGAELGKILKMDAGYLSRILRRFEHDKLVKRTISSADARQTLITLTIKGRKEFLELNRKSDQKTQQLLADLDEKAQAHLVQAMRTIESILVADNTRTREYTIRQPQPGDMGWIVHRHGVLYSQEYGWNEQFEALVAGIVADFVKKYNPERERCWIAEKNSAIVGSVFLVEKSQKVAKLRLLFVEPSARGLGIGKRLVAECIGFARQAGYRQITLWTNSILHAARHIYEEAGFHLVEEEPHQSFGQNLIAQTWELKL